MIFTPASTSSSARPWAAGRWHRQHADDDVLVLDDLAQLGDVADRLASDVVPTLASSVSKIATTRKPWSAKMSEDAIALPRCPAPNSAMLCWPAVRRILRICETSESTL